MQRGFLPCVSLISLRQSSESTHTILYRSFQPGLHPRVGVYSGRSMCLLRDIIDHNRNIIFNRTRESCQTLTKEVCDISYCLSFLIVLPTHLLSYISSFSFLFFFCFHLLKWINIGKHLGILRVLVKTAFNFVTLFIQTVWVLRASPAPPLSPIQLP